VANARRQNITLADVIMECKTYHVIFIDPEHLKQKEWCGIRRGTVFRNNLVFGSMDEMHLSNDWGKSFRIPFKLIGTFLHAKLPSGISHFGLTATLEPGETTQTVCRNLGFYRGSFQEIRRSNKRPNIHLVLETITKRTARAFPYLAPYLSSGRKTIIHAKSFEEAYDCYRYIRRAIPGDERTTQIRMYHAGLPDRYNQETLHLMETSPQLQIIVATVAITFGINVKGVQDSLSISPASTEQEQSQRDGRPGHGTDEVARSVVFVMKAEVKTAEKALTGT
jgi:superfamily II DNA helicase RecQ